MAEPIQYCKVKNLKKKRVTSKITEGDFPDGPVAKTLHSQFNPWSGTRSCDRTKDLASGKLKKRQKDPTGGN